jgi:hypothetical protein
MTQNTLSKLALAGFALALVAGACKRSEGPSRRRGEVSVAQPALATRPVFEGEAFGLVDERAGLRHLGTAVDAKRVYLHLGGRLWIVPRGSSGELRSRPFVSAVNPAWLELLGAVEGGEVTQLVWSESLAEELARVMSAPITDEDEDEDELRGRELLRYRPEDRVALGLADDDLILLTRDSLIRAPISGGAPRITRLDHEPTRAPLDQPPITLSSREGRVLWAGERDDESLILSMGPGDASPRVEHRVAEPRRFRQAAWIGDGEQFVYLATDEDRRKVVRLRDGEALVWLVLHEQNDRIYDDGEQVWALSGDMLWRIDAEGYGLAERFDEAPTFMSAEAGLLTWAYAGTLGRWFSNEAPRPGESGPLEPHRPPAVIAPDASEDLGLLDLLEPQVPMRVRQAKPEVRGEGLDADIVRRIHRAHQSELRRCYASLLERDEQASGTIVVRLEIGPSGTIERVVGEAEATLEDRATRRCVREAIRKWRYPKPRDGATVEVVQSWTFTPAS